MGTLQMKGIVSGFGKGLQQGLQNTQAYMTQSMIQDERQQYELKRLKLTYGYQSGLLQEANAYDAAKQDKTQAFEKDMTGIKHQNHKEIVGMQGAQQETIANIHEDGETNRTTQRITAASTEGAKDRTSRENITGMEIDARKSEGDKQRSHDLKKQQVEIGARLTEIFTKLQEAHATKTDLKLQPQVAAKLEHLKTKLEGLNRYVASSLDEDGVKQAKKEMREIDGQVDQLLGFSQQTLSRKPLIYPEDIADLDPWRGTGPLEAPRLSPTRATGAQPAESNLPRFGNIEPTTADIAEFLRQYEAATKSGEQVSSIVKAFKNRFGRIPSQADFDRVRSAGQ